MPPPFPAYGFCSLLQRPRPDDGKARQSGRTERRRDRDVGRVAAPGDDDPAYPRMIVTRIERVPMTVQKNLEPGAEVHWRGIAGHADIAKIAGAVPDRDVHAATKRDRQVGEVAANTYPFLMASDAVRSHRAW
jgi:hypothetical protein